MRCSEEEEGEEERVDAPRLGDGECVLDSFLLGWTDRDVDEAEAGWRPRRSWEGLRCWVLDDEADVGLAIVVLRKSRVADSGAEGGGGRDERMEDMGRIDERQRKHSPVP